MAKLLPDGATSSASVSNNQDLKICNVPSVAKLLPDGATSSASVSNNQMGKTKVPRFRGIFFYLYSATNWLICAAKTKSVFFNFSICEIA